MGKTNGLAFPGEAITTEEEFSSGKNTFGEGGVVRASIVGKKEFDDSNKEVRIKGNAVTKLMRGDIVTAKVNSVSETKVLASIVSVEHEEGGKKAMSVKDAALPVRSVSNAYVTNLKTLFKVGDIIRARVAMASELAVDLETNEKGLGAIKAYCSQCRKEMSYSNGKLMCLNCGSVEERKWFEAEDERSERRGFGDRGGGRSGSFGGRDGRSFGGRDRGRGGFGERSPPRRNFGDRSRGERRNFNNTRGGERSGFGRRNERRDFGGRKSFGRGDNFGSKEKRFEKGFKRERRHFSDRR